MAHQMSLPMSKPIAVLCSDVHYSLPTLEVADKAMRLAIAKANELKVPLIVAGDIHETKANMRAECVNAMISTFMACNLTPIVLVGNHDKINEKSADHSLNFLSKYAFVLSIPFKSVLLKNTYFIPYYHNSDELRAYLKLLPKGATLIMHQGLTGTASGEYIQDKSAINPKDVAGFRVISGHYHTRQTIALPDGGTWDYVGNPYTVNFGEANDPPKGFQILFDDGSLEFVPINLRKHIVLNADVSGGVFLAEGLFSIKKEDLVWVKVKGTAEQLMGWTKALIQKGINHDNFRLDLIPTDTTTQVEAPQDLPQDALLDGLIDSLTNTTDERKLRLKDLWKTLVAKE